MVCLSIKKILENRHRTCRSKFPTVSHNGQAYPTFANDRQLMLYEFIFNARNFYTLSCKCGETQASLFASAAGKRSYVQ